MNDLVTDCETVLVYEVENAGGPQRMLLSAKLRVSQALCVTPTYCMTALSLAPASAGEQAPNATNPGMDVLGEYLRGVVSAPLRRKGLGFERGIEIEAHHRH